MLRKFERWTRVIGSSNSSLSRHTMLRLGTRCLTGFLVRFSVSYVYVDTYVDFNLLGKELPVSKQKLKDISVK